MEGGIVLIDQEETMRVITHLGLGETKNITTDPVRVELTEGFLGERHHLLKKGEFFLFTDRGHIHVINVRGIGPVSNLRFHLSGRAARHFFSVSRQPPNETIISFNLESGTAYCSQPISPEGGDFLILRPYIDRWAMEHSSIFKTRDEAVAAFEQERNRLGGTEGIGSAALISPKDGELLRFYICIARPHGVIFDWRRGSKVLRFEKLSGERGEKRIR